MVADLGQGGPVADDPDPFDDELISDLLDADDRVERPWLERRVRDAIEEPGCRIVLVTAEPGAGKSVLLAGLARVSPHSVRYFLRRDSLRTYRAGDVHSFLESVGLQLAARFPDLYLDSDLVVEVTQSAGPVSAGGRVVGVRAEEVIASPFRRTAIRVSQELDEVSGDVIGVDVKRLTVDVRAMDWRDVQHLALLGPARAMARVRPAERVLVVVDALDESADGIGEWLGALPDLPDSLRIVVSARPGEYLEPIRLAQGAQLCEVRLDTGEELARADVARYLTAAGEGPALAAVVAGAPAGLLRRWSEAAGGNFQYAATLVKALTTAIRQDDAASVDDLLSPNAVPPDLRSLYTFLVTRVRTQVRVRTVRLRDGTTGSAWEDVYAPVLGGLAVARQPMTARELAAIVADRARPAQVRDALADMSPFLDERGGRHRLHHRSFADFLTDPATETSAPRCYLDAQEWHRTLGLLGARSARDSPRSASAYARAHSVHHLLSAGLDDDVRPVLTHLTTHFAAIEERIAAVGVDAVADEQIAAAELLGTEADLVRDLGRVLDRQRHLLRRWPAEEDRPFLAQQVVNEARVGGFPEIAGLAESFLDRSAALPVAYSVGSDLRPQLRTIDVRALVHALARIDDDRFAAGCSDGTVRVYAVATGRLLESWGVSEGAVLAVAWSPRHGIVWGSVDGYVGRWHPDSGRAGRLPTVGVLGAPEAAVTYDARVAHAALAKGDSSWLQGGPDSVHSIAVRETDGEVAVGTRQGAVLVVHPDFDDFAGGAPLHEAAVTGLHFSPTRIVACSHDGSVRATDLGSMARLAIAPGPYTGLTVLPDGRVAASRWDGATDVTDPREAGAYQTLRSRAALGAATAIASGATGRLYLGFSSRRVWVHDEGLRFRVSLRGHGDDVTALAEATSSVLVSAARDRTVRLWDITAPRSAYRTEGHDGPVSALLPVEGVLLSGSADGTLRRWGPAGAELARIPLGAGQIWGLCTVRPGEIAAATQSGHVLLLDPSGRVQLVLTAHTAEARAVVALDADRLVTGDTSGHLVLWERGRAFGRRRGGWKARALGPRSLVGVTQLAAISGSLVAMADGEDHVTVVDVDSGSTRELRGHVDPVHAVGRGPAGTVLSGGFDGTARRWDVRSGECLEVLSAHDADVSTVAVISPGLMLTGTGDGTVQLWRMADQERLARVVLDQPVDCLAVDPRTSRISIGHANGSITVLDAADLLSAAGSADPPA